MRIYLLTVLWLVVGCQRKEQEVHEASLANPNVSPPSGPICRVVPFHATGFYSQNKPIFYSESVFIQEFDLSKGDTLALVYKCPTCPNWIPMPQYPSSAGMSYQVTQSTVTLNYQHVGDWVWSLDAGINVCN